jgi:hypothetical protein
MKSVKGLDSSHERRGTVVLILKIVLPKGTVFLRLVNTAKGSKTNQSTISGAVIEKSATPWFACRKRTRVPCAAECPSLFVGLLSLVANID